MRRRLVIAVALNVAAVVLVVVWLGGVQSAYDRFRGTESFGFSTVPSADEALDFQLLLRDPRANSHFAKLARDGTPAAQLYALCGLFHSDRAAHAELKQRLSHRQDPVTFGGCLSYDRPLQEIAKWDATSTERLCGPMRLPGPIWLALQTQATWYRLTRR